jgi:hypothetical protein
MTDIDPATEVGRPSPTPLPAPRSTLRAVALPTEHGGWGLTGEPVLLGLLVAPTWAGACLGLAALIGFVARTPLRVILVDRRRNRWLDRTTLATKVLAVEVVVALGLVVTAVLTARSPFWWPIAAAAPLVGVELWFDARSRSRRLAPELAGTVGVTAVAAAIVLAGGEPDATALAAWLVLSGRAVTAIPHIRAQVQRLHGRTAPIGPVVAADVAAVSFAGASVVVEPAVLPGAVAVGALVALGWATAGSTAPPKVLGLRQTFLGLAVVIATAAGLHLS